MRLTEVYHDDADNVQHWEALLTDVMSGCPAEAFLRAAAVRADMDAVAGIHDLGLILDYSFTHLGPVAKNVAWVSSVVPVLVGG